MQTKQADIRAPQENRDNSPFMEDLETSAMLKGELAKRKELIGNYQKDCLEKECLREINYCELRYIFLKYFECDITSDELEFIIKNHSSKRRIYLDTTRIKKSDLALFFKHAGIPLSRCRHIFTLSLRESNISKGTKYPPAIYYDLQQVFG